MLNATHIVNFIATKAAGSDDAYSNEHRLLLLQLPSSVTLMYPDQLGDCIPVQVDFASEHS